MRIVTMTLIAAALAACQPQTNPSPTPAPVETPAAKTVDMHTSRNSLNWAGIYEGILNCPDCAGVATRLTLGEDGRFSLVSRRLVWDAEATTVDGQFEWETGDRSIAFQTPAGRSRFAVGERGLLVLEGATLRTGWGEQGMILTKLTPAEAEARASLDTVLSSHRWSLFDARAADNLRISALFPVEGREFEFQFADSRMGVRGGCNGLGGGFTLDPGGVLSVSGTMSTLMACEPALMEADAAIGSALTDPLQTVLNGGAQPTLALVSEPGAVLLLRGELTHEARLGEATRVFLEVDAQTVACEGGTRGDGQCLRVREITFDDQGIKVGEPSEWRAFPNAIEGYEHEPGIRNVLRLKRFAPGAGAPEGAYVLDLVVESQVVEPAAS